MMLLIQSLDPRPGQSINTGESEYVIPTCWRKKRRTNGTVELNGDSVPRLKINQQYAALGNSASQRSRRPVHPQQPQEAKWLIKAQSRNEMLLKVTRCIVDQQQAFFEQGEELAKPMVLADIAQAVEMHAIDDLARHHAEVSNSLRGIFD